MHFASSLFRANISCMCIALVWEVICLVTVLLALTVGYTYTTVHNLEAAWKQVLPCSICITGWPTKLLWLMLPTTRTFRANTAKYLRRNDAKIASKTKRLGEQVPGLVPSVWTSEQMHQQKLEQMRTNAEQWHVTKVISVLAPMCGTLGRSKGHRKSRKTRSKSE